MITPLPPESLESRIAPAAVSGVGDEFVGPLSAAGADGISGDDVPVLTDTSESVILPRSGNIDLGGAVPNITTVPVNATELTNLSAAAAEAVQGVASTLGLLATSALGGESSASSTLRLDDSRSALGGIDTTSALESGAASIADLVLVRTGGFASASAESLLIIKV